MNSQRNHRKESHLEKQKLIFFYSRFQPIFHYLSHCLILACLKAYSTFLYHQTSIPVPRSQSSITGASVHCTEALKAVWDSQTPTRPSN